MLLMLKFLQFQTKELHHCCPYWSRCPHYHCHCHRRRCGPYRCNLTTLGMHYMQMVVIPVWLTVKCLRASKHWSRTMFGNILNTAARTPSTHDGRGTFGVVVLATYRGTPVAVKSVLPPRSGVSYFSNPKPESHAPGSKSSASFSTMSQSELGTCTIYPGVLSSRPSTTTTKQWKRAAKFFETDVAARESRGEELNARQRRGHWERSLEFYNLDTNTLRADFIAEMRHLSKLRHPCVTTCMGMCGSKKEDGFLHCFTHSLDL